MTDGPARIARVTDEDENFLTLQVAKHSQAGFDLYEGDRYLFVLFVTHLDGRMVVWTPWEAPSPPDSG